MSVPVQVFGYLDTAWIKIGCTHGDLNFANVRDDGGDADVYLPVGFSADKNDHVFQLPGMPPAPLFCQYFLNTHVLRIESGVSCMVRH